MKKIVSSSVVALAIVSLSVLTACPGGPQPQPSASSSSAPVSSKPSVKLTVVSDVKADDLKGKELKLGKAGSEMNVKVGADGAAQVDQTFTSTVKPAKMEIKDSSGKVIGTTTDIREASSFATKQAGAGVVYVAVFQLQPDVLASFVEVLNSSGIDISATDGSGAVLAALASALDISANDLKANLVAAGVAKETVIEVVAKEGEASVSAETIKEALAAQNLSVADITKIDVPVVAGTPQAQAETIINQVKTEVTKLATEAGVAPITVGTVTVPGASGPVGSAG